MRKLTDSGLMIPGLHPGQEKIKRELKKRNYICAHRGWRKSSFAIHLVVEHLLTGQNCGWFAPTFNTIVGANWVDFKRVCYGDETWFNKSESTWTIPGKGTCFFYSMDRPDTARGATFSLGVGEEMGFWNDGVFESVVQPIIQKVNGRFVGIGTPNPVRPFNDFFERVMSAREYPEDMTSYIIPAFGCDLVDGVLVPDVMPDSEYALRGEFPFDTFEALQRDYNMSNDKVKWQIEYLCKWISQDGGQFGGVEQACTLSPIKVVT